MQEMDRRVALLRLLLADITHREDQAREACRQLRVQLGRVADFTVQYNGGVANALAAMGEVEERLSQQETILRHLGMLRQRASSEMEALLVTRGVADARVRLAELEARRAALAAAALTTTSSSPTDPVPAASPDEAELAAIEAEMRELRAQIQAASEAAARALTEGRGEAGQPGTSGSRQS
jgi:hypothetical protein